MVLGKAQEKMARGQKARRLDIAGNARLDSGRKKIENRITRDFSARLWGWFVEIDKLISLPLFLLTKFVFQFSIFCRRLGFRRQPLLARLWGSGD